MGVGVARRGREEGKTHSHSKIKGSGRGVKIYQSALIIPVKKEIYIEG